MRNWFAFGTSVVVLQLFFSMAGLPIALWWKRDYIAVRLAASPILGISLLAVLSWYWSRAGISGLGTVARPLMVVLLLMSAAFIGLAARRHRPPLPAELKQAVFVVVGWLLALVLVGFMAAPIVGIGYRTSAVVPNTDVAAYALMSQHLTDHTVRDQDPITGVNLSRVAEKDTFGSGVVLALTAGLLGTEVWKVTLPALIVVWIDLAVLLAVLAWKRIGLGTVPAFAVAATAVTSSFFATVSFSYFFGQLLGVAFVLVLFLMLTQERRRGDTHSIPFGQIGLLAFPAAGLILTYPIFALSVVPAIGLATLVGAATREARWVVGRHLAYRLLGGFLLGAALLPDRVLFVWQTLSQQTSADYGFPLRGLTPLSMIGLQRFPADLHRTALIGTVVVVIILIAGVLVAVRHDYPLARELGALMLIVFLGWLTLLITRGSFGYQTWKWVSYFQPFLVCGALALAVRAAAESWVGRSQLRSHLTEVTLLGLGGLMAITTLNGRSTLRGFENRPPEGTAMAGQGWLMVDQLLADLENNSALHGLREININLSPFWEEMWAAYFLRDTPRINLMSTSYFPTAPADQTAWTLQRVELTPDTPGVRRVLVNERYVLVDKPSPPVG